MTTDRAVQGPFIQPDSPGLDTTYEKKHPILSILNITIFNHSANSFRGGSHFPKTLPPYNIKIIHSAVEAIMIDLRKKYLGGMIGSALGDAIGELAFRHSKKEDLDSVLEASEEFFYSDDTAMAWAISGAYLGIAPIPSA